MSLFVKMVIPAPSTFRLAFFFTMLFWDCAVHLPVNCPVWTASQCKFFQKNLTEQLFRASYQKAVMNGELCKEEDVYFPSHSSK